MRNSDKDHKQAAILKIGPLKRPHDYSELRENHEKIAENFSDST